MRRTIDLLNKLIIISCFVASVVKIDPAAAVACLILYYTTLNPRCCSLHYLMLIYNLHFSMRYIERRLFGFRDVFYSTNTDMLPWYFLLSALMYLGIAIAINASAQNERETPPAFAAGLGKVGVASMLIFSVLSFSGQYSIGREIANPISRILIRVSIFLQYWMPALFFVNNWWIWAIIYSAAMLVFGSKAFLYSLVLNGIIYGVIANIRVKAWHILTIVLGAVLSLMMFGVMLQYRQTKQVRLDSLMEAVTTVGGNSASLSTALSFITTRWGGLDTLAAYGQVDFRFSPGYIGREAIVAINGFVPGVSIPLPPNYLSSELYTAYLFRGYNFYSKSAGELTHTDSMFGLSRFIAVDYGGGMVLYALCLLFAFIFRTNDHVTDSLVRMFLYTSVIIGGSYNETIKLVMELGIILIILRIRGVRAFLGYYSHSPGGKRKRSAAVIRPADHCQPL